MRLIRQIFVCVQSAENTNERYNKSNRITYSRSALALPTKKRGAQLNVTTKALASPTAVARIMQAKIAVAVLLPPVSRFFLTQHQQ
jgi:hypothetical protein